MVIINKIIDSRCYERIFFLIFKRHLSKSVIRSCEKDLKQNVRPKGKISIIKRKFTSVDEGANILEWKSAASVIKKINFENKHLFGPVLNSPNAKNSEKILETNKIIQHKTLIPIIEPLVQQNIEKAGSEGYQTEQEVDLNSIVAFPLHNKSGRSDNEVNKLNLLRRNLECLSRDKIPSVSLILQKTMPEERVNNLDRWKQNMIKQLGEEGFQRYHTALLDNGASLHSNISSFLSSTPESELIIKEENIGHWHSLKQVLRNVNDVKLLEEYVTHPFLCYRGIVDCFAKYRDHLVVIDWKTSKKAKTQIKDLYDNPLQIAAYVGALNFDPNLQYLAEKGLIVVAYESGAPANMHFIDASFMKQYWIEWLKRVKKFWELKKLEVESL